MNYTNLIDSCEAHLTVQDASSFARSDTGVVIDSEQHQVSLLFSPLAVRVQDGCFTFPFYTLTKQLNYDYISNTKLL